MDNQPRTAILLRETYREDGKVKNRTLTNFSKWSPETLAALAAALDSAREDDPTGGGAVATVPHGHVQAVLGTTRRQGMDTQLLARPCLGKDLVLAMIAGRILIVRTSSGWISSPDEVITIMDGVKEKLNTEEECLPAPLNLVLRPGTHPTM